MKRTRSSRSLKEDDDEIFEELKIEKKSKKQSKKKENNNSKPKTSKQTKTKKDKENSRSKSKSKSKISLTKSELSVKKSEKSAEITIEIEAKVKKSEIKLHPDKPNQSEEPDPSLSLSKVLVKSEENNIEEIIINGMSSLGPKCIRLGLCCINNFLRAKKNTIFCSRSLTLSTYKSKGKAEAIQRATQNVKDIEALLRWNKAHYIHVLRLSSDIFPHYTNVTRIDKEEQYTLEFAKADLASAGKLARSFGHRITMHPGPYNVVGTPNEEAFNKTILDLQMHADILDHMGMDANSVMVVHGGGTYGNKEETVKRWIKNFARLPENVRRRLVLENDEKNFSIIDCIKVNEEIGIPLVFDNHHFECYRKMHPLEEFEDIRHYIKIALDSWTKKGLRPKFHISNQAPDKNIGAHSNYIQEFPEYYLEIPKKYGIGLDIMIEAKAKEAAILDLYQRYTKDFMQHLDDEEEADEEAFEFDREKMMALECTRCDIDD